MWRGRIEEKKTLLNTTKGGSMNHIPQIDLQDYLRNFPPNPNPPDPPWILLPLEGYVLKQIGVEHARMQAKIANLNSQILLAREEFESKVANIIAESHLRTAGQSG